MNVHPNTGSELMIRKPDYLPDDFVTWVQVEEYSMAASGYVVHLVSHGDMMKIATFIFQTDAYLFARMKNDILLAGGSI